MNKRLKFVDQLKSQILKTAIITLLILLSIFYVGTYIFNENYNTNRLNDSNFHLSEKIVDLFKSCEDANTNFLSLIDKLNTPQIYDNLYKINSKLGIKSNLALFDIDKKMIFTSNNDITLNGSYIQYINILLKNLDSYNENYISIKPNNFDNQLLIGKKNTSGYSILIISENDLIKYLDRSTSYVITDKKNHVVVSNNYRFIDNIYKFIPDNTSKVEIDDTVYLYKSLFLNNNLNVISFVIKQNLLDMKVISASIIFIAALLTILLNTFSKRISKNTAKSLDLLMNQIDQIKEGKAIFIGNINTNDEFEILAKEINSMLERINQLNFKNTELLNLNKQIEIKQLESQFNPHFLYNTLETIRYVMYMDTSLASDLVLKLTQILRYSISNKEDQAKLEEDIIYMKNYLEICKVRYQERFNYTIKTDERCLNLYVPKLIYQPLIENSIKHNFKNKDKLSIWVTTEIIDNKLHIEVEDDGDGMSDEYLNNLNSILSQETNSTLHIGLYNVYKRLKLKYNDNFRFDIFSKLNIGTRIIIVIPVNTEEG